MRRRIRAFSRDEIRAFVPEFIEHFGELHELAKIRLELEALRDRLHRDLENLGVWLGGNKGR